MNFLTKTIGRSVARFLRDETGTAATPSGRPPQVFGYGRASTKRQVESPETQKEMIKKYAVFNSLGDVTFYVDAAKSGKIAWDTRDAGREMFKGLRRGDHVIITKLDRAFRRLADCVAVLEKFERMGIKLHICNLMGGAIDLSSPMGRFMIHILAAFAELERAFISERTKDGLAAREKRGVRYTRHAGYGFRWEKRSIGGKIERVRVRDDEERNVMRAILMWRMQDGALSWDQIREHLQYTLKLKTKEGKKWDGNRIRRACQAELALQMAEQKARG